MYMLSLLQKRVYRCQQLRFLHYAARPPQHFAVFEQHECGYRLYAILVCSHPILVHIHLDDADSVTQHFLHLLQDGVHHLAWLAPCGEEINQPTHEARAEASSLDYALQEGGRRSQDKLVA